MWLFLISLFALGILSMGVRFSLFERWQNGIWAAMAALCAMAFFHPLAIHINTQDITDFLNRYNTLSNLCIIMIFESLAMFLLIPRIMRTHFQGKKITWSKGIVLCPSISGLGGCFVGLVYLLNNVSGQNLATLSCVYLMAMGIILILIQLILRWIATGWQSCLDVVLILAFIQFVVTMFLPLLVRGMNIVQPSQKAYFSVFIKSAGCTLMIALLAYGVRKLITVFFLRYNKI